MRKTFAKMVGLAALALPTSVLAGTTSTGLGADYVPDRISSRVDAENFFAQIINWFLGFIGLIAVVMFIYGGVLYLTAGGNDEQTGKAKKAMLYAVIGIVIVLLAYTIVGALTSGLEGLSA